MSGQAKKSGLAILGAGPLGRAVGKILVRGGVPFRIWSRSESTRNKAKRSLGEEVVVDTVEEAASNAFAVLLAVPAPALRAVCEIYGEVATGDQIVVHGCRGVAKGFTLPHQIIREETCVRKIGVLGGPLHAVELASGRPLAVVLASRFEEAIRTVTGVISMSHVRIHPSRDVVGVEVAGAISNVTALALGMADGLELKETPRGILMMRGLTESTALGLALGASRDTFAGLAGVGDLIPRRAATTENHRIFGSGFVTGANSETRPAGLCELEGVVTAKETHALAVKIGLSLPLVSAVAAVLAGDAAPAEALDSVLRLDLDLAEAR